MVFVCHVLEVEYCQNQKVMLKAIYIRSVFLISAIALMVSVGKFFPKDYFPIYILCCVSVGYLANRLARKIIEKQK